MTEPQHLEAGASQQVGECPLAEEEVVVTRREQVPARARHARHERAEIAGAEGENAACCAKRQHGNDRQGVAKRIERDVQ